MSEYLPLHDEARKRNATFMNFSKWEVPAYFSSIIDEHTAVRTKAGLFDISHMGMVGIEGPDAVNFLQYVMTNNIARMKQSDALYSIMCNQAGGIIDDVFVYKRSDTMFFLVINASNIEKDVAWLKNQSGLYELTITDLSDDIGILALQGPLSGEILKEAWGFMLDDMPFHTFTDIVIDNIDITISTTGYTGEWGCEIFSKRKYTEEIWKKLMRVGEEKGLKPIGFGARDTLRLEAGCLLYGQDMDEKTTPYEAGLGWVVKLDEHEFIGKDVLSKQKLHGLERERIAFEMIDKGIPRHDYAIYKDDRKIGHVSSGSYIPTLEKCIGLGYVVSDEAKDGNQVMIEIRTKKFPAKIVTAPFYKRKKIEALHKR